MPLWCADVPQRRQLALERVLSTMPANKVTHISAADAPQPQNDLASLDPGFETVIGAIFERAKKAKGLFSTVPAKASATGLDTLLEQHDPRHVSVIVEQIRRATEGQLTHYYNRGGSWFTGVDGRLIRSVFGADPDAAYPLMTVWSGHVREAAVQSILTVPGSFCLALIVHRLNDWVAEVRVACERKLAGVQGDLSCATVFGCIEYLWEFGRVGRARDSARQLVQSLASRPDVLQALRREALSGMTDRALRIVRRSLRSTALDNDLLTLATASRHPHIRATATRALLTKSVRWRDGREFRHRELDFSGDAQSLARRALGDDAAVVQLAGLEYVVTHGESWNDYESILMRYAVHSRNSIAELAQWGLGKAGVDWVGRLRQQLFDGAAFNHRVADILGKVGDAQDGARIYAAADALTDDLALPVLGASALLKVEPAVERLRRIALTTPNYEMARRASRALRDAGVSLDVDSLKAMADRGDEFFARGLGRHVTALGVMAQLIILARLERARTNFDLPAWFARAQRKINRGAFTITVAEKAEFQQLLAEAPSVKERAQRLLAIG